ncbi:MAG: sigma 54-interacting transcriptional regulator [Ignavibacteriales bacterium]|nr:sigma 54-interacting transcriptional regulator [Ignavibacteriales bacterium]
MTRKNIVELGIVLGLFAVVLMLSGPMGKLEDQTLDARYSLRGQLPADSNIVILYFDNDDIASLGGWPLTRNYYALLINVLTEREVAAIGVDILFGEPSLQYPEYDNLLVATTAASKNVVLSSYFRQIGASESTGGNGIHEYSYPRVANEGLKGVSLQLPFAELLKASAGVGHANLLDGSSSKIPLFIQYGQAFPAFGLEILRVYKGIQRDAIAVKDNSISFSSDESLSFRVRNDGTVNLNFTGSIYSFKRYRCIEVLRSFELQKLGVTPSVDLSSLRGKIVLISVIGEGRSQFVASPMDPHFPAIGLHATFLDNALHQRFLKPLAPWVAGTIAFMFALLALLALSVFGESKGGLFIALIILMYGVFSQVVFSQFNVVMPVAQPFLLMVMVTIGIFSYNHLIVSRKIAKLETEKELAEHELHARALKLQMLEKELLHEKAKDGSGRGTEIQEEIKRYKEEIKSLSSKVSDLVKFDSVEPEQKAEQASFEGIVYHTSGKMTEVISLIKKISGSDANVLILGESGTGKELVARAIHNQSARTQKPFVAINCGALTESLLESELFGHERGSFTGAIKDKVGRFEYADGGTVFLDEIAETSEAFQVKLLRVVQEGEFERVGSTTTKKVNTRIIAATNKNVKALIEEKRFREDLYYRLNVFTLQLPPLRERKAEIPTLAEFFVNRENRSLALSSTVMDAFVQYHWPGNVRELESAVTRGVILAKSEKSGLIQLKDIPSEVAAAVKGQIDIEDQIVESLRAKKFSRSSISETAEELGGLNRGTVAEYFRGICFKYFFENVWDKEKAILAISNSSDNEALDKVRKKLEEYLGNIVDGLQKSLPFEDAKKILKPKYKNLPQRYHTMLDEVIRAYLLDQWK